MLGCVLSQLSWAAQLLLLPSSCPLQLQEGDSSGCVCSHKPGPSHTALASWDTSSQFHVLLIVSVPFPPEGLDVGKLFPGFPEGLPMQEWI